MSTLFDVAEMVKAARKKAGWTQHELASHSGVSRITIARMETNAAGDMSVSALVRVLEACGYDLRTVQHGHGRTLDDILVEQRGEPHEA